MGVGVGVLVGTGVGVFVGTGVDVGVGVLVGTGVGVFVGNGVGVLVGTGVGVFVGNGVGVLVGSRLGVGVFSVDWPVGILRSSMYLVCISSNALFRFVPLTCTVAPVDAAISISFALLSLWNLTFHVIVSFELYILQTTLFYLPFFS